MFRLLLVAFSLSILLGTNCLGESAIVKQSSQKLKLVILDGRQNPAHDWRVTTPLLLHILRSCDRFDVDVATCPSEDEDLSGFRPEFQRYDVIVSNFDTQKWNERLGKSFLKYLEGGGGFVCIHAANNAFAKWTEYNRVCGLGGWAGRNEKWGPYVYFKNDKLVRDISPGPGGHHGPQHEYQVTVRDDEHPITKGLPKVWKHTRDELYDRLRGPAENMEILATAFSSPEQKGTDRHEPVMMTIRYGKGRVFHTVMGHADYSMRCVGFKTIVQRGAEWAASGNVTIPIPKDFPTEHTTSSWE